MELLQELPAALLLPLAEGAVRREHARERAVRVERQSLWRAAKANEKPLETSIDVVLDVVKHENSMIIQ